MKRQSTKQNTRVKYDQEPFADMANTNLQSSSAEFKHYRPINLDGHNIWKEESGTEGCV